MTQSNTNSWIQSSRYTPCPVCGRTHDDNCSIAVNGETVLCHTRANPQSFVTQPPDEVGGYKFSGGYSNSGVMVRAIYHLQTDGKPDRPERAYYFDYPDRDGNPNVRVRRFDQPGKKKKIYQEAWNGKTWVKRLSAAAKSKIRLYRINDPVNVDAKAKSDRIIIVEGELCVDVLLEIGVAATTNIGGSGKWNTLGEPLAPQLQGYGAIVIAPDCQLDRSKKNIQGIEHGLLVSDWIAKNLQGTEVQWLYANPSHPRWWPTHIGNGWGYDLYDWVISLGEQGMKKDAIAETVWNAIESEARDFSLSQSKTKTPAAPSVSSGEGEEKLPRDIREMVSLHQLLGDRLRFNSLRGRIELDGQPLEIDGGLKYRLYLKHKIALYAGTQATMHFVGEVARENQYNPVVEYLESLQGASPAGGLDTVATRHFGNDSAIANTLVRKALIAAVARAYEPGCKHDSALILQGAQGVGKSTWFELMAGEEYFTEFCGDRSDRDAIMGMHGSWVVEMAELETVFKRRDVSQLKAFLSDRSDRIRVPYAREMKDYPRHSIIVGSTNLQQFLADPTGNRRFWVVEVKHKHKIDFNAVRQERDALWGEAVAAYKAWIADNKSGQCPWVLNEKEGIAQEELASEFAIEDVWAAPIVEFCDRSPNYASQGQSIAEMLENILKIEIGRQGKQEQMRLTECLTRMGWVSRRVQRNGQRSTLWFPPTDDPTPNPDPEPKPPATKPKPIAATFKTQNPFSVSVAGEQTTLDLSATLPAPATTEDGDEWIAAIKAVSAELQRLLPNQPIAQGVAKKAINQELYGLANSTALSLEQLQNVTDQLRSYDDFELISLSASIWQTVAEKLFEEFQLVAQAQDPEYRERKRLEAVEQAKLLPDTQRQWLRDRIVAADLTQIFVA